jgi:hypothetical protein
MAMSDDAAMFGARMRQAAGTDDDLDRHRLRAAERQQQPVTKDFGGADVVYKQLDDALQPPAPETMSPEDSAGWNAWFARSFDAEMKAKWVDAISDVIGETSRDLRTDFEKQIHRLEREVSELRGEMRMLRNAKLWTPGND